MSLSLFCLSHPPSFLSCNYSAAPSLITPPCPSSPCSSGPCVCHYVGPGGRFVWAAEEGLPSSGADSVWKSSASVVHALLPALSSVHPSWSCRGSRHSCMWATNLRPPSFHSMLVSWCILPQKPLSIKLSQTKWHIPKLSQAGVDFLPVRHAVVQAARWSNISDATSSLAGSLISFQLTPSHIRGIALHFLTLSYGGGCFLGAFIIQLVYFLSGGKMNTNTVSHVFCQK